MFTNWTKDQLDTWMVEQRKQLENLPEEQSNFMARTWRYQAEDGDDLTSVSEFLLWIESDESLRELFSGT